jgi:hypothetical protein
MNPLLHLKPEINVTNTNNILNTEVDNGQTETQ